jgi:hypothetical protein
MAWDKLALRELVKLGLSWDHAAKAVGVLAEHRQMADREGYSRGYNDGYANAQTPAQGANAKTP